VGKDKFRSRVTSEDLSVSGSAHRLWAQLTTGNLAEAHRPNFISRSRHLLAAVLQVKRAAREKEYRAPMVSSRPNTSSSNNEAARLPQPITDRGKGKRKVARREHQKKRHRQGRDNFSVTNTSGSGM
jgi:hypothetical protein